MGTSVGTSLSPLRWGGTLAYILAAVAIWLPLYNHLRLEWSVSEQYRYGFFVMPLAAYLAWLRWIDRPEPKPLQRRRLLLLPVALAVGAIALVMLVEGANQDWRLLSWVWTALVVFITGAAVLSMGGVPWLRHFAVPLCFVFVAVPWPMSLENQIVNGLTARNAAASAELLNWLGVHAQHLGSVVRIANADIGIDDACSGVRSVQASIMVACLLGETYRLPLLVRALLVVGCMIAGLAFNLARTLSLVWLADAKGEVAMNAWHDQVGLLFLGFSWVAWFLLARSAAALVRKRSGEQWILPGSRHNLPVQTREKSPSEILPASVPVAACLAVVGFMGLTVISVEGWYRLRAPAPLEGAGWTVRIPSSQAVERSIPERARWILKFSRGTNWHWDDDDGRHWAAFYLEWDAGRIAPMLAGTHRPEVCLPATGRTLLDDPRLVTIDVMGFPVPFRHSVFQEGHERLHVFFHLSSQNGEAHPALRESVRLTREERLRAVRERRRNEGQRQLQVAVWGIQDADSALREFTTLMRRVIVGERADNSLNH